MPICEADPWRLQYFEGIACPDDVRIPTEDVDCYAWYPEHRFVYDKLAVAHSQNLPCAPHGIDPPSFPVFSKPIINLRGMGVGSRVLTDKADYLRHLTPGHFWMQLLAGEHISTDVAVERGLARWWGHSRGIPAREGMFDYWRIEPGARPDLETRLGEWIRLHLATYTGMLNLETIGGRIIDAHLRFADQWPDLYGAGWLEAVVRLYAKRVWEHPRAGTLGGFSVALFGPHGRRYHHPRAEDVAAVRALPGVSSVQITFHENRPPGAHAMPPGGFRLAVINCYDLEAGRRARHALTRCFDLELENQTID